MPRPARAESRCSIVETFAPFAAIVVPSVVSPTFSAAPGCPPTRRDRCGGTRCRGWRRRPQHHQHFLAGVQAHAGRADRVLERSLLEHRGVLARARVPWIKLAGDHITAHQNERSRLINMGLSARRAGATGCGRRAAGRKQHLRPTAIAHALRPSFSLPAGAGTPGCPGTTHRHVRRTSSPTARCLRRMLAGVS